jgi:hypothetical protein
MNLTRIRCKELGPLQQFIGFKEEKPRHVLIFTNSILTKETVSNFAGCNLVKQHI